MRGKFIDLTGQRFGRLTVIKRADSINKRTYWLCRCDCGKEKVIGMVQLMYGGVVSCGCYQREISTKHNLCRHPLYSVWNSIKTRCYTPNDKGYANYGGRGIKMCDEWYNDFKAFYDWAYTNGYKDEKLPCGKNRWTIDRINNDGNYCPENCRWVDRTIQANNTRRNHFVSINGETKTISQWAQSSGLKPATIGSRYKKGIRGKELLAPLKRSKKK